MNRNSLLNDPEASFRAALDGSQANLWTALPCQVVSVDFSTMTISAQATIQGVIYHSDNKKTYENLPVFQDVPIIFPSAGGFTLTLPISVGDEVLVIFSSRCIDTWWQNGGYQNKPIEMRMHDLSDGFAIPGPKSVPNVISSISSTKAQLRNNAGTTVIEIDSAGKISLTSPTEIDITAPSIIIGGDVVVSGALVAASLGTSGGGGATISGSLTAAQVTAGGIPLTTHKHTGVTTGTDPSGGPIP